MGSFNALSELCPCSAPAQTQDEEEQGKAGECRPSTWEEETSPTLPNLHCTEINMHHSLHIKSAFLFYLHWKSWLRPVAGVGVGCAHLVLLAAG